MTSLNESRGRALVGRWAGDPKDGAGDLKDGDRDPKDGAGDPKEGAHRANTKEKRKGKKKEKGTDVVSENLLHELQYRKAFYSSNFGEGPELNGCQGEIPRYVPVYKCYGRTF